MTTRIEDELVDLAAHLDVPDGDAAARRTANVVSARVRADDGSVPAPPKSSAWWRRRRTWIPIGIVAAATALVASPAVGDWFGIRGVEVIPAPPATTSTSTSSPPAGAALDLGRPSTTADAAKVLGVAPVLPSALGPPDEVWLDTRTAAPYVSFVYEGGPLVSEFDATMTDANIITKFAQGGAVEELRIDGRRAMWIDGVHQVVLRARNGDFVPERLRQSDSVLLVQIGDLTVRIETGAGRDEAIRIARSLG